MDLLRPWKRSARSSGVYPFNPTGPNQQWHSDVMYAWIGCRHYFLLSFVDAYSRYVVHHRLLLELTGRAVAIELEAALSKCKGAKPRIVRSLLQNSLPWDRWRRTRSDRPSNHP